MAARAEVVWLALTSPGTAGVSCGWPGPLPEPRKVPCGDVGGSTSVFRLPGTAAFYFRSHRNA